MADKGIAGYSVSEWERMEQRINTLRTQLKRHGGHAADCAARGIHYPITCDCGWAKIAKELG